MLPLITSITTIKPNSLIPEEEKDKQYHVEYARWIIVNANNKKHNDHMNRITVNKSFFSPNGQWCEPEDLEGFFLDESNQDNNRIRVEMNYIHSMVKQYMGNASRMSFYARAKSMSPMTKSRKEQKLQEMLFYTDVAQSSDEKFGKFLRQKLPIGQTEQETQDIFENVYVDHFVKGVNNLLKYTENVNKFKSQQKAFAMDLALSGMCINKPYIYSGEYLMKRTLPERFFFDRNAINWDLSDCLYMGEWDLLLPTDVYECFQEMEKEDRETMERFVQSSLYKNYVASNVVSGAGRLPIFEVYWRDVLSPEFGYVKDELGEISLERLNYVYDGEETARFTKKDLVNYSELSPSQAKIINKGRKTKNVSAKLYVDQWRYCIFIPSYIISAATNQTYTSDIVLAHGVVPYQEPDLFSPSNTLPPYKVGFNVYMNGDVISPIDIAINPQRMINRFYSIFENQVNNSGGQGSVFDVDSVDDPDEVTRNVKQNKPIFVRSKGLGIPNVTGKYDNSVGSGTIKLVEFAKVFKDGIEQITGVNEALKGQSAGADQLVGVMQLMIQRGSIVQETFYDALEEMYTKSYQAAASSGRRFYIDNERKLNNIVGSEDEPFIDFSKFDKLEDYMVELTRSNDPQTERTQTDAAIMTFMQAGLLDGFTAANLLGRATTEDLYQAIREYAKKAKIVQQQQAQIMQEQAAAQQQQQQQMIAEQQQMMAQKEEQDKNGYKNRTRKR